MRNIVKGDYTKSVKTQIGYKKVEERLEGDVWEEGNKIIDSTPSRFDQLRDDLITWKEEN